MSKNTESTLGPANKAQSTLGHRARVGMLLTQTAVWVTFVAAGELMLMEGTAVDKHHLEFWAPARLKVHSEKCSGDVNEHASDL